jgi:hypothetical protein
MYSTTIDGLPHEFTDAEKIDWLTLKGNYLLAKKYHGLVHTKTSFGDLVDIADKIQKIERVAYKRAHGGKPPTPLRDSLKSNPRGWTWAHAKARSYAKSKRRASKKRRSNPAKRIDLKVTQQGGNYWLTGFNGTLEEAKRYFMGVRFEDRNEKLGPPVVRVELV